MRYEIAGLAIRDTSEDEKPGDAICVSPELDFMPDSANKWPENARKIVAALNWVEATGLTFEQVENTLAAIERSRMPVEIEQVEFKDDRPHLWGLEHAKGD